MNKPLAARDAFILGAIDSTARRLAVALAEAGASISVTTATREPKEEFVANSILNEAWSLGRAGAAFVTDGADLEEIRAALGHKDRTIIVAMPVVAGESWPRELAHETGAALIQLKSTDDGLLLVAPSLEEQRVSEDDLAQAVVELLSAS
jgi:hypothetical protein